MVGQLIHQAECQIAMGINDRQTMTGRHILQDQVFKQARFAGAGLADHIQMEKAILMFEAERLVAGTGVGLADDGENWHTLHRNGILSMRHDGKSCQVNVNLHGI